MSDNITFTDNSALFLRALEEQTESALEEIGLRAVGYAQMNAPVGTPESTGIQGYSGGSLRKSMTYKVVSHKVFVGTNLKANGEPYPVYVELGTGIYASEGNGRKSPWAWTDKNGKKHWTRGIKPTHFLKKSVSEHKEEYIKVLKKHLKGKI